MTVHSVRAASVVLDLIEEYLPETQGAVVLHWFTGSRGEAKRAVKLGCYFSINAEVARNESVRSLISGFPIDRLLTETDGPFTQAEGRPAEPTDSLQALDAIAKVRSMSVTAVSDEVGSNLQDLLEAFPGWGRCA